MAAGRLTALELVDFYLARIDALDQHGPRVNSIIEVNPDARDIAQALDMERRAQGPRGPLHGIPVVLKDNIDTADRMLTTAGSLALVGDAPAQDATVAQRLRDAGAVILGKANLSEWANFRGFNSTSGFSGRGRLAVNPYALDRNACGSSSGSAAAVSANFCAAALGTETDGSIVCPSGACGVVGLKPTLGLTSRAGVIPIAHSQDVVGPHGRTVADVAAVLGALTGVDPRDPATAESEGRSFSDYTQFLDSNGLRGARIGVPRQIPFTYGVSRYVDAIMEDAIQAMTEAGAIIIDPAELPSNDDFAASFDEIIVLIYEFKRDLNAYLATRTGVPVHTLADVIAFNEAHAAQELQFFGQEIFELAEAEIFSEQDYLAALPRSKMLAGEQGIDAVMDQFKLDALVAPTGSLAWTTDLINGDHFLIGSSSFAAVAGYPNITVPAGSAFGLPVGISFFGRAYSEPTLIKLASGFEHAIQVRRPPQFLPTLPLDGASSSARHLNRSAPTVARPVRPFQPWAL
jgi:amidase